MKNKAILFQPGHEIFNARLSGSHRIAHYLRTNHDWDVEVVEYVHHWSDEQLRQFVDSRDITSVKWIGISLMWMKWVPRWEALLQYIKSKNPNIVTVIGSAVGPDFKSDNVDYYLYGYGELGIVKLLEYEFSNGPRPVFLMLDELKRKIVDCNDQYPAYPMRSLKVIYEDRDFITSEEALTLEFSRGCKFQCAFCNYPILGVKGDYTRDADDFEAEVKDAYNRFGVTRYAVADETFNDRTEKITKFADVVDKLDFETMFTGFIRADLLVARPKDREELARMNFVGHYYGIETFHKEAGKLVGKGYDPDKLKQGLLDVKNYFYNNKKGYYSGTIGLINGLPAEPVDSMLGTLDWAKEHWSDQSLQAFTLELVLGDLVKKSKLCENYEKYGYRELPTVRDHVAQQKSAHAFNNPKESEFAEPVGYSAKVRMWESDLTNVHECDEITDLYAKEQMENSSYKLNNWSLNTHSYLPLDEVFSMSRQAHNTVKHPKDNPRINRILTNYINNKINWTP